MARPFRTDIAEIDLSLHRIDETVGGPDGDKLTRMIGIARVHVDVGYSADLYLGALSMLTKMGAMVGEEGITLDDLALIVAAYYQATAERYKDVIGGN